MQRARSFFGLIAISFFLILSQSANASLRLGIYPGTAVGKVHGESSSVSVDERKRNQLLNDLAGAYPLNLHVYTAYTGRKSDYDMAAKEINGFPKHMPITLVVRYRPQKPQGDVEGYKAFIEKVVISQGHRLYSIEITNEAGISGQPHASDGAYPKVVEALRAGVIEAKRSARKHHLKVQVGFNWGPCGLACDRQFFAKLKSPKFARSVDYVGAHLYPGTWSDLTLPQVQAKPSRTGTQLIQQIEYLKAKLKKIGIKSSIHISETGFPTSQIRTPALQNKALNSMFKSVQANAGRLNITMYSWFSLQDQNTASGLFEDGYGLITSDYQKKPAFTTYQKIIKNKK